MPNPVSFSILRNTQATAEQREHAQVIDGSNLTTVRLRHGEDVPARNDMTALLGSTRYEFDTRRNCGSSCTAPTEAHPVLRSFRIFAALQVSSGAPAIHRQTRVGSRRSAREQ